MSKTKIVRVYKMLFLDAKRTKLYHCRVQYSSGTTRYYTACQKIPKNVMTWVRAHYGENIVAWEG